MLWCYIAVRGIPLALLESFLFSRALNIGYGKIMISYPGSLGIQYGWDGNFFSEVLIRCC